MTSTTRHLMVGLMMTGLVSAGRLASAEGADHAALPRVRSSNATIAALIKQAVERSKTFRGLVETINASDGIVYVEEGTCCHGVRACFVTVTVAGPNRILRVKVDTRQADSDLMWLIGHELRHTVEVLSDRTVTSQVDLYFFYGHMGQEQNGGRSFETAAAIEAGEAIRAEVRQQGPRTEPFALPK
jgi:hypothetical protein